MSAHRRSVPLAVFAALSVLGVAAFAITSTDASAQPATQCPQFFVEGKPPVLENPRLATKARPLCYGFFTLLHSGVTRTPLWAAEHLTRASVEQAACVERVDVFHPDPNLPEDERAELSDYRNSGYDRGHMAPAGDMPTAETKAESFTLANMIPQARKLNQRLWACIEGTVQGLALRYGDVYVVTGPAFIGSNLQALKGRVIVPTNVFKAVYVPRLGQAGAYYVANEDDADWQPISIHELRQRTGIDIFPALSAAIKGSAMSLPNPSNRGRPHCS